MFCPRSASEQCALGPGGLGKVVYKLDNTTCQSLKLQFLSEKRASCLQRVGEEELTATIASCFDAARVGKPAQDLLMHLIWDMRLSCVMVAAPKDR